jgi:hypothetical protein
METKRVTQSRMKLTWFGAVNSALAMYLGFFFGMQDVVFAGLGLMGVLVGGYQATEGYTKGQFLKRTNPEGGKNERG